jgi:hypothetical protein
MLVGRLSRHVVLPIKVLLAHSTSFTSPGARLATAPAGTPLEVHRPQVAIHLRPDR